MPIYYSYIVINDIECTEKKFSSNNKKEAIEFAFNKQANLYGIKKNGKLTLLKSWG